MAAQKYVLNTKRWPIILRQKEGGEPIALAAAAKNGPARIPVTSDELKAYRAHPTFAALEADGAVEVIASA